MSTRVSNKLTDAMIYRNAIQEESREIVMFGLHQGLVYAGNLITFLLIGWCFGMILQTVVYLILYMPIRIYSGGYHARTQNRCYMFSCIMLGAVLALMKTGGAYTAAYVVLATAAVVLLFILSPVENRNKPLDDIEERVYRHRAHIVITLEILVCMICVTVHKMILLCACSSLITNGIMAVMGYAANKRHNNQ